jgi:glycosyltransferase involved in cell wall biosynthesis
MRQYTILHTIETCGPGGAETVLLELATRLDPQRFRSCALLPYNSWLGDQLRQRGVPTYSVESKAWWDFRLPRAIARVVRDEKVDLVHSHLPDQNFYSSLAGWITGCKTVVTYHGPVELLRSRPIRDAVKLWVVRNSAAAVVVVCDFVGEMLKQYGFPSERIVRIYNGISLDRTGHTSTCPLRKELGLCNGNKLVGMVANVRQSKGYEYFIRTAKKVCNADPEVHFVSVGNIDEQLAKPLWKLVDELAIGDQIHFLGFRKDVHEILQDLDVFVLTSTSEGLPLATLEAMAAGKPVVVTRCGGPQEVIDDGSTGYVVPVGDTDALADRISQLLANPEHASSLGMKAQVKIRNEFRVEHMVTNYQQLYQRLIGTD